MAYQLRERAPPSLADMQNITVSVEEKLIAKRNRARGERRTTFKEEPSSFEQKLDAIIKGMDGLGDRVETIERKSSWEAQTSNTTRNPNFRKNPNLNSGKTGPDQNIRPPFQENCDEASTSCEPTKDHKINLMGLKGEEKIFLPQDDQEAYNIKQFQTKSGESFYFKEGYDVAVYEVHKQYKLRSKTIDLPETATLKYAKQAKKTKDKVVITKLLIEMNFDPKEPIVEDISDLQPLKDQS